MHSLLRRAPVLIALLLLAAPALSQTGKLSLSLSPKNAQVRIDGRVLDPADGQTIALDAGTYQIEVWAPYFKLQTGQVTIRSGETTRYTKGLVEKASDYAPYLQAKSDYATKKLKRTIPDLSFTAAYAVLGYVLIGGGGKARETRRLYDRGIEMQEQFYLCPHPEAIIDYQAQYGRIKEDYDASRVTIKKRLTYGIPLMTVATGALAYHLIRRSKSRPVRPVYEPAYPFANLDRFRPQFRLATTENGMGLAMTF